MSLVFLVATYNESAEIIDLLDGIAEHVDAIVVSDDGSTDDTLYKVESWAKRNKERRVDIIYNDHIGLAETVKRKGVEFIRYTMGPDQWILMLDADERLDETTLKSVASFAASPSSRKYTHIWFDQHEIVADKEVRRFLKCKLYRAENISFSDIIHVSDQFTGPDGNFGWEVTHRKSADKQALRESEYVETYKKLLEDGKVSEEWVNTSLRYHYFVKELGLVPHG